MIRAAAIGLAFVACLWLPAAAAQGLSDRDKEVIELFFEKHPSMQDKSHVVRFVDSFANYPPCDQPIQVVPPLGHQKLWGSMNLTIECAGDTTDWRKTVPVRVLVFGTYAVTARALPPGYLLTPEDYIWTEGEITAMVGQLAEHESYLLGAETARAISQGAPIRLNDIRPMSVIKRGETVTVTIVGKGFAIETTASALGNAQMGDTLQIRTKEGKVVSAVATGRGQAQIQID